MTTRVMVTAKERAPLPRWRGVAGSLLDLVVSQYCAGCTQPGSPWCPDCALAVDEPPWRAPGPLAMCVAAAHDGPAGRAVVAFKEHGSRRLAGPLSVLLAGAVAAAVADLPGSEPIWLVPVPSRRSARRARGFDPVAVLAARAAAHLRRAGMPAHRLAALRATGGSIDQVGLGREQRMANLAGTMTLGRPRARRAGDTLPAGQLVIVDDVTTTGATLAEARRALAAPTGRTAAAATVTRSTWEPGDGVGRALGLALNIQTGRPGVSVNRSPGGAG